LFSCHQSARRSSTACRPLIEDDESVPDLLKEFKTVTVDDGTQMRVYYARPSDASRHCSILVFQEAFGVNAHIRGVTERLAADGFLAVAPELFHRTGPGFEGSYDDMKSVMPHMQALTDEGLEKDVQAAYRLVTGDSAGDSQKIASVGFCVGGRISFLANSILPLKAAVSFYGGGIAPSERGPGLLARCNNLNGPTLFFWGGADQHIGIEQRNGVVQSMREAGKPFLNVEFSEAGHGFFCDARQSYHKQAAKEAWSLTIQFLHDRVGLI
jgi:carboxymethylenebutenolidase